MKQDQKNVFGESLEVCSLQPLTGFLREGDCRMPSSDVGRHGVWSQVTQAFLDFTRSRGNDLTISLSGLPGLKPGDRWCLCADRWREAHDNGVAPPVILASTHAGVLNRIPLAYLKDHSLDAGPDKSDRSNKNKLIPEGKEPY